MSAFGATGVFPACTSPATTLLGPLFETPNASTASSATTISDMTAGRAYLRITIKSIQRISRTLLLLRQIGEIKMARAETPEEGPWWRSPKATSLIVVGLAIVAVAERDIQRCAPEEIRGSKLLWRLVSLNALGALAYLKWGRATPATKG